MEGNFFLARAIDGASVRATRFASEASNAVVVITTHVGLCNNRVVNGMGPPEAGGVMAESRSEGGDGRDSPVGEESSPWRCHWEA